MLPVEAPSNDKTARSRTANDPFSTLIYWPASNDIVVVPPNANVLSIVSVPALYPELYNKPYAPLFAN